MELAKLQSLAIASLIAHKLSSWRFVIDTAPKRRLGQCRYRRREIAISAHHAIHDSDESVIDTLLHEIAHALVGPRHGHDRAWRSACRMVGALPRSCAIAGTPIQHPPKYVAQCCSGMIHRYRCDKGTHCAMCHKRLNYAVNPEYNLHRARLAFALLSESERRKLLEELSE